MREELGMSGDGQGAGAVHGRAIRVDRLTIPVPSDEIAIHRIATFVHILKHVVAPEERTLVDLGANACIPCKMMAPILTELEADYRGKAAIIFIDVWQNQDAGKRFKVSMIPTQIFFDRNGKEVYRHSGFMDKKTIMAQLAKMGVAQPPSASGK